MKFSVTNSYKNKITVKVFKKTGSFPYYKEIDNVAVPVNGNTTWTDNVSKNGEYYIKFYSQAEFEYYVTKG